MKKRIDTKKEIKRIKKTEDTKVNKRRNQREPDLWKEIRFKLKLLSKAYHNFLERRRVVKQKEERKKQQEKEEQRLKERETQRLQQQEERK